MHSSRRRRRIMRGLDVTDEGQLEFSDVVLRKPEHFLRRPSKTSSLALARACPARSKEEFRQGDKNG